MDKISGPNKALSRKKSPRVPWKTLLKTLPVAIWGLVALVVVVKMKTITIEELKMLASILKQLAGA